MAFNKTASEHHEDRQQRPPGYIEAPAVVYGIHAVTELLNTRPNEVDRIYFEKENTSQPAYELLKTCRRLRLNYHVVPPSRLAEICKSIKHQGVAAQCTMTAYTPIETVLESIKEKTQPLLVLPASVEDPGNLGAIVRSCVAFGADAVLLEQRNTAPLGWAVAKSAAGMLEHLPVCRPRNLEAQVGALKQAGWGIIGANEASEHTPGDADYARPVLLVMGGENRGIPPYLAKLCTDTVGIPIRPPATSLNVSVATGVMLYEIQRQRNNT